MIPIFFEITLLKINWFITCNELFPWPFDVLVLEFKRDQKTLRLRDRGFLNDLSLLGEYWLTASHIPLRRVVTRLTVSSSTIMDLAQEVILSLVRPEQMYQRLFSGLPFQVGRKGAFTGSDLDSLGRSHANPKNRINSLQPACHPTWQIYGSCEFGTRYHGHILVQSPPIRIHVCVQGCMNAHLSFKISCSSTSAPTLQMREFRLWVFLS
jgi:hypothetical protein